MSNDVEEIDLYLHLYKHATIDEARDLFVKCTELLLDKINQHEKIRPFLREYPFTSGIADKNFPWCRANISISFMQKDGSYFLDGSVAFVSQSRGGNISYSMAELQNRKMPNLINLDGSVEVGEIVEREELVDLLKEPYEEAVKALKMTK